MFFLVCVFFMFKLVFSSVCFNNVLARLTFTFYFLVHYYYLPQTTVTLTNVLLACTFVACFNKLYCIVNASSPRISSFCGVQVSLPSVFKVENQRWENCTSAFGLQTGGFGPWSLFITFEVWELWISINGGAGTAFPCVQWHFNHWLPYIATLLTKCF